MTCARARLQTRRDNDEGEETMEARTKEMVTRCGEQRAPLLRDERLV